MNYHYVEEFAHQSERESLTKIYCEIFGTNKVEFNPRVNRWDMLPEGLRELDRTLSFTSNVEEGDAILIVEAKKNLSYYQNLKKDYPNKKMTLIIVEMPAVNPGQHTRRMQRLFDEVFIPNLSIVSASHNAHDFDFPINFPPFGPVVEVESSEKLNFGYVGTCKNSLVRSSLYSLRPKILNLVSEHAILHLAGRDWNSSRLALIRNDINSAISLLKLGLLPNLSSFMVSRVKLRKCHYVGEVDSKSELLLLCDVVLCIENDINEFSEKFFDAVSVGKVPFYIGPHLERLGIPNDMYFYGGTNIRSARKALNEVNTFSINEKLKALEKWREVGMNRWEGGFAFKKLCNKVNRVLFYEITAK